jgi:hypothetical protein
MVIGLLGRVLEFGAFSLARRHFEVGRRHWPRRGTTLALALRIHDPKIMFGVLIEVFRRDPVAARLRLARQGDVPLEHLIGAAADFNTGTVAVESLLAVWRARAVVLMRTAAATAAASTASPVAAA